MKIIVKLLFVLSILVVLFSACKKEDDLSSKKNYLNIGNTEYVLSSGILENYGKYSGDSTFNLDLTLMSSGLVVHQVNGVIDSITGIGHGLFFELFSSEAGKLNVGEYVYNAQVAGEFGTYDYANGIVNYNTKTKAGTKFEIKSGILTILKNADVYEISFDDNELGVSFHYEGSLFYYDYDITSNKSAILKPKPRFK